MRKQWKISKIPYHLRTSIHDSIWLAFECNKRNICIGSWIIDLKSLYLNEGSKCEFHLENRSFSCIFVRVFRRWLVLKGFRVTNYERKRRPKSSSFDWWKPQVSNSFRSWAIQKTVEGTIFWNGHYSKVQKNTGGKAPPTENFWRRH